MDSSTGERVYTIHSSFFEQEVDVYTLASETEAKQDTSNADDAVSSNASSSSSSSTQSGNKQPTLLYRAHYLSKKFSCATNKVDMFLHRRRLRSTDPTQCGIYQASFFLYKTNGPYHVGLKTGNYFVTDEACNAFEEYLDSHKPKRSSGVGMATAEQRGGGGSGFNSNLMKSSASAQNLAPSHSPTPLMSSKQQQQLMQQQRRSVTTTDRKRKVKGPSQAHALLQQQHATATGVSAAASSSSISSSQQPVGLEEDEFGSGSERAGDEDDGEEAEVDDDLDDDFVGRSRANTRSPNSFKRFKSGSEIDSDGEPRRRHSALR